MRTSAPDTDQNMLQSIAERLSFLKIGKKERATLQHMRTEMADILEASLTDFYTQVKQTPQVAHFFKDAAHMRTAQSRQSVHWNMIFSGKFDAQYIQAVTQIGGMHAKIGLEPRGPKSQRGAEQSTTVPTAALCSQTEPPHPSSCRATEMA